MGKLSILLTSSSSKVQIRFLKSAAKGGSLNSYKLAQNYKKSKITFTFTKCHLSD